MKLVPIADAKAHLSEILAALEPGEEIVVTRWRARVEVEDTERFRGKWPCRWPN